MLICTVFPHFEPFSGGRVTEFCGQEFDGHPDFFFLIVHAVLKNATHSKFRCVVNFLCVVTCHRDDPRANAIFLGFTDILAWQMGRGVAKIGGHSIAWWEFRPRK